MQDHTSKKGATLLTQNLPNLRNLFTYKKTNVCARAGDSG